jgi:RNA polymerase sigma-70 factor, ECF subfamily
LEKSINNEASTFRALFEECFHLHYEGLHRYAYTILKDNEYANDVVQTVFARWWENKELITQQQTPQYYLYTALRNRCLNHIRDKKNRKTQLVDFGGKDEQGFTVAEDPILSKELSTQIMLAIEDLPPQCKLIFCKNRFGGMKYAEIAQEMNLSVKTVEAQIGKALKILRGKLNPEHYVIAVSMLLSILLK